MNDQVEGAAVAESNRSEVANIAGCQATDTEPLGERHDRRVHQAEAEIGEASVDFHRARELTDRRWRVGEGALSEILHEQLHRPTLVTQEVVDLGEHQTGNVSSTGLVNDLAKLLVVGRALDHIVEESASVAMSAAVLPAGTEQLALVAALR
jgi:hypothetical protein